MGATLGPAIVGEMLHHITSRNFSQIISEFTDTATGISAMFPGELAGIAGTHALVVSMKEIYGILLIICIISVTLIAVSYGGVRPWAIFPKWRTIRRIIRREAAADTVRA